MGVNLSRSFPPPARTSWDSPGTESALEGRLESCLCRVQNSRVALRLQLGQILHALEASQAQVFQAALIQPMFGVGCEHPLYLRPLRKPSSHRSFLRFSLERREKWTFLWCPKGHQHQVLSESGSGQTAMFVHPQSLSSVGPHCLPFFPTVGDVGSRCHPPHSVTWPESPWGPRDCKGPVCCVLIRNQRLRGVEEAQLLFPTGYQYLLPVPKTLGSNAQPRVSGPDNTGREQGAPGRKEVGPGLRIDQKKL